MDHVRDLARDVVSDLVDRILLDVCKYNMQEMYQEVRWIGSNELALQKTMESIAAKGLKKKFLQEWKDNLDVCLKESLRGWNVLEERVLIGQQEKGV